MLPPKSRQPPRAACLPFDIPRSRRAATLAGARPDLRPPAQNASCIISKNHYTYLCRPKTAARRHLLLGKRTSKVGTEMTPEGAARTLKKHLSQKEIQELISLLMSDD